MLAQLLRAGQLTEVWIPDEAHEAVRDLVRMRAQAMKDLRKTRQQLHSFLLRHARVFSGGHWTKAHRRWLGEQKFAHPAQHLVMEVDDGTKWQVVCSLREPPQIVCW